MIDYATPLLLALCGIGVAVIGAFFYKIGRSDERNHAKQEYEAENANLRMFINLKETCWKYVGLCDECPYNGMDDEHDDCNCTVQEKIDALARELRIGVN